MHNKKFISLNIIVKLIQKNRSGLSDIILIISNFEDILSIKYKIFNVFPNVIIYIFFHIIILFIINFNPIPIKQILLFSQIRK